MWWKVTSNEIIYFSINLSPSLSLFFFLLALMKVLFEIQFAIVVKAQDKYFKLTFVRGSTPRLVKSKNEMLR